MIFFRVPLTCYLLTVYINDDYQARLFLFSYTLITIFLQLMSIPRMLDLSQPFRVNYPFRLIWRLQDGTIWASRAHRPHPYHPSGWASSLGPFLIRDYLSPHSYPANSLCMSVKGILDDATPLVYSPPSTVNYNKCGTQRVGSLLTPLLGGSLMDTRLGGLPP